MRTIPPGIAAAMADGATTLCRCWIVRRTDGVRLGFTDHDAALAVEGVACQPESGLDGTEADASLGFSVGGGEITGVLTSDAIAEADIAKGLWDNAAVETWLVDWSNPAERILLASGTIGEIRRQDHAFSAELRGPAHALDQPAGRLFQASCSADLGDARCRVNLEQAALKATLPVDSAGGRDLGIAAGLAPYPDGLFAGGTLVFETGANAGARLEIRNDSRLGDAGLLSLWQAPPRPAAIGDTVTIRAGCDKQLTTCRNRFNNLVNFRGFARMPGNDFVLGYARQGQPGQDGGFLG